MGDLNIDIKSSYSDKYKLQNVSDFWNLTNLVHLETCFIKNSKTIIDLISHFQNTRIIEGG